MQLTATFGRAALSLPKLALKACPSSWFSWACYWTTLAIVMTPQMARELITAGPGLWVIMSGLGVFFAAVVAIQRHMRLELKATSYGEPQRLVTGGVFQYSRNPIYVAFLVPLASIAYVSVLGAAFAIAAYVLVMNVAVISAEERLLQERFGASYRDYKASVPRWLA